MAKLSNLTQQITLVELDTSSTLALPVGPSGGQPIVAGHIFILTDNMGVGKSVTLTAPFSGGLESVTVGGSVGWGQMFVWSGTFYIAV